MGYRLLRHGVAQQIPFMLLVCLFLGRKSKAFQPPAKTNPPFLSSRTLLPYSSSRIRLYASRRWQTIISRNPDGPAALYEILSGLEGGKPGLALLFVGQYHAPSFVQVVEKASKMFGPGTRLMALVGGGVVGGGSEIDEPSLPAMAMLSGSLPEGARLETFSFQGMSSPPPSFGSEYWEKLASGSKRDRIGKRRPPSYILFADPWAPIEEIIQGLDASCDGAVVAGGISCPNSAQPTVALDGTALPQGSAVGLCLTGTLGLQALVCQGARPVGPTFTVTSHDGNVLEEIDGKSALEQFATVAEEASAEDKKLIGSGYLLCGIGPGGGATTPRDLLVRQIIGFQPQRGAILVGGVLRKGDAFRFHVRDRDAALEDMRLMVNRANTERLFLGQSKAGVPLAAMQVSCVARGRSLFGKQDVDLSEISDLFAEGNDKPIAGFFANGEIGPVGIAGFAEDASLVDSVGHTHIHGFTTIAALICDYSDLVVGEDMQSDDHPPPTDDTSPAWG